MQILATFLISGGTALAVCVGYDAYYQRRADEQVGEFDAATVDWPKDDEGGEPADGETYGPGTS